MKRISFVAILIAIATILLGYNYKTHSVIKSYYRVYYKNELLGTIKSKSKLEDYINNISETTKKEYNTDNVYIPEGTHIEKLVSYYEPTISEEKMYKKIIDNSPLTIDGYLVKIKKVKTEEEIAENKKDKFIKIYVLDEKTLDEAIDNFIYTYAGKSNYLAYLDNSQKAIKDTGSIIENVYIENDISVKKVKVSTENKIYLSANELSKYLVFGTVEDQKDYTIKPGDTIESVSFNNKISVDEFLISNPNYTSATNILMPGEVVTIGITNPQLNVVIETYNVADSVSKFKQEVQLDKNMFVGEEKIIQKGEDGIDRVTQRVKSVNGIINYVEPVSTQEIKASISQILAKGDKYVPTVGNLKYWSWPTNNGWTISDGYYYRINPITGAREHHSGIDITGTGYGSPVYAANNGVVMTKTYAYDYGYYVIINHNNGYWTIYAHLSRFGNIKVGSTVASGQVIGYVGSTGWSTGPHLHFEVRKGDLNTRVNPWSLYGN